MSFFWINQSKFKKAYEDGFIRADVSGTDHARRRILDVRKGDVFFSFSRVDNKPYLRALLVAREDPRIVSGSCKINCDYTLLDQAYDFDIIIARLDKFIGVESVNSKYSPINKNKKRCQGYIYPLEKESAQCLFEIIGLSLDLFGGIETLGDNKKHPTERRETAINRIVRDTKIARDVKRLYGGLCQVCQEPLVTPDGNYSEGAHIIPLGAPHNGPDSMDNILCLCPNHHVLFDKYAFSVSEDGDFVGLKGKIKNHKKHKLSNDSLRWHTSMYEKELQRTSK